MGEGRESSVVVARVQIAELVWYLVAVRLYRLRTNYALCEQHEHFFEYCSRLKSLFFVHFLWVLYAGTSTLTQHTENPKVGKAQRVPKHNTHM